MNNLTIIGFVGGNAEVIDLKKQDGSTVTTFSVATKEVRGAGEARKEYATWHKVAVYGGLQKFAGSLTNCMGKTCTPSGWMRWRLPRWG